MDGNAEQADVKKRVADEVAAATEERGVVILLTGDGKGKTSSALGMVMRCLGYGYKAAVVQFLKGRWKTGEERFLKERLPEVEFYQMGTGFTWETQDREKDIAAAEKTWAQAERLLRDERIHLLVLDELTYMLDFKYLSEERVLGAIQDRPREMTVVVTGRGGGSRIRELADTVAEIGSIKHAFEGGVRARKGVDF